MAKAKNGLTAKQERFVHEYLVDLNATRAAIRAGYSEDSAAVIGWENLRKPNVAGAISEQRGILLDRADMATLAVLEELRRVGFAKLSDMLEWDADGTIRLTPSTELSADLIAAVAGVEEHVTTSRSKDGEVLTERRQFKFKLHDKLAALDKLARYLDLYSEKDTAVSINAGVLVVGESKDPKEWEQLAKRQQALSKEGKGGNSRPR